MSLILAMGRGIPAPTPNCMARIIIKDRQFVAGFRHSPTAESHDRFQSQIVDTAGKNRLPKNHFYQRRIVVSLRLALELT
jgi:hypothetical protein